MNFAELDLRPEILEALESMGFKETTAIQETVIPHLLKGKDVSGLAQTGTGKTGAFVLPLLDRWLRSRDKETKEDRVDAEWKPNSYYLVLVPTRELAAQVESAIRDFGQKTNVKSVVVAGGNSYEDQKRAIHEGVQFVVGTPGRLLDLYKSHDLDLNGVRAIVFDEADRMFDMGFRDEMKFILRRVPRNRQLLLFSATLNFEVINTAYQFGAEPLEFNISRDKATADGVDHEILHVGSDDKPMYLLSILKKQNVQQCIVFSNFKNNVGRVAKFLKNNGIEATAMSSLLSQAQRNKVLEGFKTGGKACLVATDVAARGLDIKGVDLVVNYELPDDPEGYVHRIGRTGRAGTLGKAVALVSDRDVDALQRIETYLKHKIKTGWYEDSELIKEFSPLPRYDDDGPKPATGGRFSGRPPRREGSSSGGRPSLRPSAPRGPRTSSGPQHSGPRHHANPPTSAAPATGTPRAPDNRGAYAGQHRDRKTGRHQGPQGAAPSGSGPRTAASVPRHHQAAKSTSTGHQNSAHKRRPLNKSSHRTSVAAAQKKSAATPQKGITGKIKGLIGKLFK